MKKLYKHQKQSGEIAATLAFISMILVTFGIFLGTRLASNPELTSTESLAQASGASVFANSHIDVTFSNWEGRSNNPKHDVLTGQLCFKSTNPPSNGKFTVEVWGIKKAAPVNGQPLESQFIVKLGQSLEQRIDAPPNTYECGSANYRPRNFSAIFWNQFTHVPTPTAPAQGPTPTAIPFNQIDEVVVVLRVNGQNWNFRGGAQSPFKIGLLSLSNFGNPPVQNTPTVNPSISPSPSPSPALTVNPSHSPTPAASATPAPTSAPGDLSVKVKFENQKFTGDFNVFEFFVQTCDYTEPTNSNEFGTVSNCSTGANKKSNLEVVRKPGNSDTINQEFPISLSGMPAGKRVIEIQGGFFKNYDNPATKKKDTTGIKYDFGTTCIKTKAFSFGGTPGRAYCLIDVNGNKEQVISVKLPNTTEKTFKLIFGKETTSKSLVRDCAFVADKDKSKSYAQTPCVGSFTNGEMTLKYQNTSSATEKIYWHLNRCHGNFDQNNEDCLENFNGQTGTGVDNKSVFLEAASVDVPAGSIRTCTFKPAEFPVTETDETVRAFIQNKCTVAVPSATPIPSSTPTAAPASPTPVPTEEPQYFATFSIYNNGAKDIKKVNVKQCFGTNPCETNPLTTTIAPKQRGTIDMELKFPEGINLFKIGCAVEFDGIAQAVECPAEVESNVRQNIIFRISVDENSVIGDGLTELQASDVNSDGCTNGSDFSEVVNQYATDLEPSEQNRKDINGDGAINSIDIEYTLSNLNRGENCQYKPGGFNFFDIFQ